MYSRLGALFEGVGESRVGVNVGLTCVVTVGDGAIVIIADGEGDTFVTGATCVNA